MDINNSIIYFGNIKIDRIYIGNNILIKYGSTTTKGTFEWDLNINPRIHIEPKLKHKLDIPKPLNLKTTLVLPKNLPSSNLIKIDAKFKSELFDNTIRTNLKWNKCFNVKPNVKVKIETKTNIGLIEPMKKELKYKKIFENKIGDIKICYK